MACSRSSEHAVRNTSSIYSRRTSMSPPSSSVPALSWGLSGLAGRMRIGQELGFHPATDADGIGDTRVLADRVEKNNDNRATLDDGLHDQAAAGFGDVTGFLDHNVPAGVGYQGVGVAELEHAAADVHSVVRIGRVLAD